MYVSQDLIVRCLVVTQAAPDPTIASPINTESPETMPPSTLASTMPSTTTSSTPAAATLEEIPIKTIVHPYCLLTMYFEPSRSQQNLKYPTVGNLDKARELSKITVENFQTYADLHGYPLFVQNSSLDHLSGQK